MNNRNGEEERYRKSQTFNFYEEEEIGSKEQRFS